MSGARRHCTADICDTAMEVLSCLKTGEGEEAEAEGYGLAQALQTDDSWQVPGAPFQVGSH